MTPRRHNAASAERSGTSILQIMIIAIVLLVLVLAALRLLPHSPFAAEAAAQWGIPAAAPTGPASQASSPTASPSATPTLPPLPVRPTDVKLDAEGWWGWAILDTRTGKISGSKTMTETSTTASMIKAWISADYLRRATENGETPSDTWLSRITKVIRDSHNTYAEQLYNEIGRVASIKRLIDICELTDSHPADGGGWSRTELSPRDTARMGACIADGRAAGPEWTDWLLNEMRLVRGTGDFGIRKAFPSSVRKTIAIKNGWVDRTREQEMHISCMAIGAGWTMGVMVRYPINRGYDYGMRNCQEIASQLRVTT